MNIFSTLVSIRNTTAGTIAIGTISITAGNSVLIWDTVNYSINGDNFRQVENNIGVFNQNIQNGNFVLVIDSVDQSVTQAFDNYNTLHTNFTNLTSQELGLLALRFDKFETKGLTISHGDISNLSNDDHQQYLLTNGTRHVTGNLIVSGSVSTTGGIDGINITTHASRHAAGGEDQLNVNSLSGTLATAQKVMLRKNSGADVGPRQRINFIESSNITIAVADDGANNETTVTLSSAITPLASSTSPVNVDKSASVIGVSSEAARADHKHNITTATASSLSVGGSNAEGTSTSLARADHTHSLPAFGSTAGTFAQGNDARLSDNRIAYALQSATTVVYVSASVAPLGGQALIATGPTTATWQTLTSSGGDVMSTRTLTAGAGLTGGGDLSADRTFNVGANADGSITVNANDIQVGVLATDAQHGSRGGGSQHSVASNTGAGFLATLGTSGSLLNTNGTTQLWSTPSALGLVTGTGTVADNTLVRFDGATGKIIQGSGITIDDSNNMSSVGTINSVNIATHASRHAVGGSDQLSVDNLSGTLANPQKTAIQKGGSLISTRTKVNFIEGSNVTLTVTDDTVNDRTNVTIAATGGGPGGSITSGIATIDFGSTKYGSDSTSVAVTGQTGILAGSVVTADFVATESTTDHSIDEHIMSAPLIKLLPGTITAGVGFTINAVSYERMRGQYKVRWTWQ